MFFRPKPKFKPGQFVSIQPDLAHKEIRYLLIQQRRLIRPYWVVRSNESQVLHNGMQKLWVYDGPTLEVAGKSLILSNSFETSIREAFLARIPGLEYE